MKFYSKFLISNICQFNFITYIKKITIVNILGQISCQEIQITSTHKVSIKCWQNINEGLFKVKYLVKLIQYFGIVAKAVMRSRNKKFLTKVSKILAENNGIQFLEVPHSCFARINCNLICAGCCLYFLMWNPTQNV